MENVAPNRLEILINIGISPENSIYLQGLIDIRMSLPL